MNAAVKEMGEAAATFEAADDLDAINRLYREKQWSDGLPIVPPTAERVERMLAATRRERHEIVAHVAPAAEVPLYGEAEPPGPSRRLPLTAVPYALWANPGVGGMRVWLPVTPPDRHEPSAAPNA